MIFSLARLCLSILPAPFSYHPSLKEGKNETTLVDHAQCIQTRKTRSLFRFLNLHEYSIIYKRLCVQVSFSQRQASWEDEHLQLAAIIF